MGFNKDILLTFAVLALASCALLCGMDSKELEILSCERLNGLPFADDASIITRVTNIVIPEVPYAFNPSIVKRKGGYLLAFRDDPLNQAPPMIQSRAGLIQLHPDFSPDGPITYVNTGNNHSSDPRLFHYDGKLFTLSNHLTHVSDTYLCHLDISCLDPKNLETISVTHLQNPETPREKNWTPFVYTDKKGNSDLYLIYTFNPMTVARFVRPFTGKLEPFVSLGPKLPLAWENNWGQVRGGTPALLIDDEYVAFFHTYFYQQNKYWYVFGALTFEKEPPFRIKKISPYPILFHSMFKANTYPGWWFERGGYGKNVEYPSGFVEGEENGREVFYVVCGENDRAITLLTIDKMKLLSQLIPVN